MQKCAVVCSVKCPSYISDPDAGIYSYKYLKGEDLVFDEEDKNFLIFLMSGSIKVDSEECHNYILNPESFIFCYKDFDYKFEVLADSVVVISYFKGCIHICDMEGYNNILKEVLAIKYSFNALKINRQLKQYLEMVITYQDAGIDCCKYYYMSKATEMSLIFKFFYKKEDYLQLFYHLMDPKMMFRSMVEKIANNVRTVKELSEQCGYSLSRLNSLFKIYFNDTPYNWLQKNMASSINNALISGEVPIKQIIEEFGFTDHGHFSRYCKKYLGDTPKNLQKR